MGFSGTEAAEYAKYGDTALTSWQDLFKRANERGLNFRQFIKKPDGTDMSEKEINEGLQIDMTNNKFAPLYTPLKQDKLTLNQQYALAVEKVRKEKLKEKPNQELLKSLKETEAFYLKKIKDLRPPSGGDDNKISSYNALTDYNGILKTVGTKLQMGWDREEQRLVLREGQENVYGIAMASAASQSYRFSANMQDKTGKELFSIKVDEAVEGLKAYAKQSYLKNMRAKDANEEFDFPSNFVRWKPNPNIIGDTLTKAMQRGQFNAGTTIVDTTDNSLFIYTQERIATVYNDKMQYLPYVMVSEGGYE